MADTFPQFQKKLDKVLFVTFDKKTLVLLPFIGYITGISKSFGFFLGM